MTVAIELIRTPEFIRASPHGILDFAASKETLGSIVRACVKRGLKRALLDLRGLPVRRVPFTCAELVELVETFRESGFGKSHKLAVLYSEERHRGAPLFSFIGRMHGWNVRAIEDFEEAMHWLSLEGSVDDDLKEHGNGGNGHNEVELEREVPSELKFRRR